MHGKEPDTTSALRTAQKLQIDAAQLGFDWPEAAPVFGKVREELAELEVHADNHEMQTAREEEFGDLLFACINLARHLKVEPERALNKANEKFQRRFKRVRQLVHESKREMQELSLEQLDRYWEQSKREGS